MALRDSGDTIDCQSPRTFAKGGLDPTDALIGNLCHIPKCPILTFR